jgi:opacity protein-like surface antigen
VTVTDTLKNLTVAVLAGLFALALAPEGSEAQVRFGGQLNFADETDFGLGPRVAFDLEELGPRFQIIGTWDIYFPENDAVDFWELNGNIVYRFDLPETEGVDPYGGGGLNVARTEVGDVGDTDLGLNILGGVEFPLASVTPFVELRVTAEGADQFYITGGVLVP